MVYRGKPSAKCGRCRTRGMKCDLAVPQCSQCIRARVNCPGYRDLASLLFHNESDDVIRRAHQKYAAGDSVRQKHVATEIKVANSPKQRSVSISPSLLETRTLSPSIRDQAASFIHRNYIQKWVWLHSAAVAENYNPTLSSAIIALGLGILANIRMSPALLMSAREEYSTALVNTNRSLVDPVESKTDQTLVAVMFLGMFEVATYRDAESIRRWTKHIEGATRLLEWRGEEQLENPNSLHLFRLLRGNILTSNIFEEVYASPIIAKLSRKASNFATNDYKSSDQLANYNFQLSKFCADVHNGVISDPVAKIGFALALDAGMEAWAAGVPSSWRYKTIIIPNEIQNDSFAHGVYGKYYHVYPDLYICSTWNNWRAARSVIHEMILDSTATAQAQGSQEDDSMNVFEYTEIAARSERITRELQADIIASVPYHFGTTGDLDTFASNIDNFDNISTVGGLILMWPLFLAADCRYATLSQREWAIMCLQKVGHGMGISQALAMAALLQSGKGSRIWVQPQTMNELEAIGSLDSTQDFGSSDTDTNPPSLDSFVTI